MAMIVSHKELENLGDLIREEFLRVRPSQNHALDVDSFATRFLHLAVRYTMLSDDQSFLGVTAYRDTVIHLDLSYLSKDVEIPANTVILDRSLAPDYSCSNASVRRENCRRFTLAHECAHQILYRLESPEGKLDLKQQYAARRRYSCRKLKTDEDWNEWQANALAAVLLMPRETINNYMKQYNCGRPLISYEGMFDPIDRMRLNCLCSAFGVSKSAIIYRLRQTGWLSLRPRNLYHDRLEVTYEEI